MRKGQLPEDWFEKLSVEFAIDLDHGMQCVDCLKLHKNTSSEYHRAALILPRMCTVGGKGPMVPNIYLPNWKRYMKRFPAQWKRYYTGIGEWV